MRLPNDYRFTSAVKGQTYLTNKKRRVEKIREEEFGKQLEEAMDQKESETKKKGIVRPRFIGNRTTWA